MSRRLPIAVLVLLFSLVLAFDAREAAACRCGRASPEMHLKGAKRVFLARIGETQLIDGASSTTMTVLHTFKGNVSAAFTWQRTDQSLCAPQYDLGEVRIVFVGAGDDIHLCSGNFAMTNQIGAFFRYAKSSKQRVRRLAQAPLEALLGNALEGYTHDRPTVLVHHTPLAGKLGRFHGSRLRYVKTWKSGRGRKDAIIIDQAGVVQSNDQRFFVLTGRYPREGLRFRMLASRHGDEDLQVLFRDVTEH